MGTQRHGGGGGGVLAMLKGSGKTSFGVVLTQALDVLVLQKVLPCLEEGAQKCSDLPFSDFVARTPSHY